MPWPDATPISTANLDNGADSPRLARAELLQAIQDLNTIKANLGQPTGAASLGSDGRLPVGQLPAGIALPPGSFLPFAGPVAPQSSAPAGYLFCDGTAVSRATYAALFAVVGTIYGTADGSTTFNLPDLRGRVPAGAENIGNTINQQRLSRALGGNTTAGFVVITGLSSTAGLTPGMSVSGLTLPAGVTVQSVDSATQVTLSTSAGVTSGTGVVFTFSALSGINVGDSGGSATHTLTTAQMPAHTHQQTGNNGQATSAGSFQIAGNLNTVGINSTQSTGGGQAHPNVQPTLLVNWLIKT